LLAGRQAHAQRVIGFRLQRFDQHALDRRGPRMFETQHDFGLTLSMHPQLRRFAVNSQQLLVECISADRWIRTHQMATQVRIGQIEGRIPGPPARLGHHLEFTQRDTTEGLRRTARRTQRTQARIPGADRRVKDKGLLDGHRLESITQHLTPGLTILGQFDGEFCEIAIGGIGRGRVQQHPADRHRHLACQAHRGLAPLVRSRAARRRNRESGPAAMTRQSIEQAVDVSELLGVDVRALDRLATEARRGHIETAAQGLGHCPVEFRVLRQRFRIGMDFNLRPARAARITGCGRELHRQTDRVRRDLDLEVQRSGLTGGQCDRRGRRPQLPARIGQVGLQLKLAWLGCCIRHLQPGGQALTPWRERLHRIRCQGPGQLWRRKLLRTGLTRQCRRFDPVLALAAHLEPVTHPGRECGTPVSAPALRQAGLRMRFGDQCEADAGLLRPGQGHGFGTRRDLEPVDITAHPADLADDDAIRRPDRRLGSKLVRLSIRRRLEQVETLELDSVLGLGAGVRPQTDQIVTCGQLTLPDQRAVGVVDFAQRGSFIANPEAALDAAIDRRRHGDPQPLGADQFESPQVGVARFCQRAAGIEAELQSARIGRAVVGLHLHPRRWRAQRLQPDRVVAVTATHRRDDVLARQQELVVETDARGTAAALLADDRATIVLQIQLVQVVALQLNPPKLRFAADREPPVIGFAADEATASKASLMHCRCLAVVVVGLGFITRTHRLTDPPIQFPVAVDALAIVPVQFITPA